MQRIFHICVGVAFSIQIINTRINQTYPICEKYVTPNVSANFSFGSINIHKAVIE